MATRSTRPKKPVNYASNNFDGEPAWLRTEMRETVESESTQSQKKNEDFKKDTKRKLSPEEKPANKHTAAAKRKSAPAKAGLRPAEPLVATSSIDKDAGATATLEAPDTALPLSKRLQSHKRTRNSSDTGDAVDASTEQEPAKKKTRGRPASAPSGSAHEGAAGKAAAQNDTTQPKRGKSRQSAPAALKPPAAEPATKLPKQPDQKAADRSAIAGKQQKQNAKQERPGSAKEVAAPSKDAPAKPAQTRASSGSSKELPAAADNHKAKSASNAKRTRDHSSERVEAGRAKASAASDKDRRKTSSGRAENTDAANKPAAAAAAAIVTTAKSAPEKGRKTAVDAADAAADSQKAAAAPVAMQSQKSKGKAAAAAAGSSAGTKTSKAKQQAAAAAADTADAPQAIADNKLPAAPPTPAGTVLAADKAAVPTAGPAIAGINSDGTSEFAKLQAEYQRLYAMYDELKTQKIQEMEGLVQEQESYIVKMGEEARQLAEHWRKEAEHQRHTAASVKAPETARQIKQLQDNAIADKAALLEKDRALLKLQAQMGELQQKLLEAQAKPDMTDACLQVNAEMTDAALDPLTAEAAAAALAAVQVTPAPPGKQFAACQFPTPAAPEVPSPGVGMQFPTPAAAAAAALTDSRDAVADASLGTADTDAAAEATAGHQGVQTDMTAATAAAAADRPAPAPYHTPGGINAMMFPAASAAAAAAAAARAARVAAAAQYPLPSAADAAITISDSGTIRKQLLLSTESRGQSGGSSPVKGLVVGDTAARPPAPNKPYSTPGGINAFMFNAATATGTTGSGAGGGVEQSTGNFAFRNAAAAVMGASAPQYAELHQQQQNDPQPVLWNAQAMGSGGSDGAGGSGGALQTSDHGSYVLGNRQQMTAGIRPNPDMAQRGARGTTAGLLTPPPAPHCTPVTAGGTPGGAAARSLAAAAAVLQLQQQDTPASTGSLQRVQLREKQLADLRAALQEGLTPLCERAGAAEAGAAAAAAAAVAGTASGTPVTAAHSRMAGVWAGGLAKTALTAVGHTPACTPVSTPAAQAAAAAVRLPADALAAALAGAAAAAAAGQSPAVAAEKDAAGFAGFFSPPTDAAAATAEGAADKPTAAAEATPLARVVLPAVGTAAQKQTTRRARVTPQEGRMSGGRQAPVSATKHLMPLTYLCDFDPQLLDHGNIQYRHNATGFTFQLGPATSALTAPTPMTAKTSDAAWADDNDDTDAGDEETSDSWEEEISFVPVAMGAAEEALPEFLKEPITFAPAGKPQFMKLLFQALADATKAAAAAAAEQQQQGRRAGRRRSSKQQQKQQGLAEAGVGEKEHADKENAAARTTAAAAACKDGAQAMGTAAAAAIGGQRQ